MWGELRLLGRWPEAPWSMQAAPQQEGAPGSAPHGQREGVPKGGGCVLPAGMCWACRDLLLLRKLSAARIKERKTDRDAQNKK